ncbi:serine/threonine-protein phosphatase [bacterium]|nr:serine/threonine-protein phosphatase [bacterium]
MKAESHRLRCLEIWGGATAVDEAVSVHGLDLYVFSRPFRDGVSGGDVYLVSMCDAGNIARIVLADVAGHGTAVSSLGRSLRRLMRKHITTADQTQLARELNAEFTRASSQGRFATALLATYFAPTDHLIVVNAGHPPALWYRSDRQTWQLLEAPPLETQDTEDTSEIHVANLPLGIIEPTPYVQFAVPLQPDDLVVFYTDAVIETQTAHGNPLGTNGLLEVMRSMDALAFESLPGSIWDTLSVLRGGEPPNDDLTVLVLHHNAADPPRLSVAERLRVLGRMMGIGRIEPRL